MSDQPTPREQALYLAVRHILWTLYIRDDNADNRAGFQEMMTAVQVAFYPPTDDTTDEDGES